jgi:hypothetical protein
MEGALPLGIIENQEDEISVIAVTRMAVGDPVAA